MIYDYYKLINSNEHGLYAKEIAEHIGIYSINNNPHYKLVNKIIEQYCILNNIENEKIYYQTKNGLKRIYFKNIYIPALYWFFKNCNIKHTNNNILSFTFNDNKQYCFKYYNERS